MTEEELIAAAHRLRACNGVDGWVACYEGTGFDFGDDVDAVADGVLRLRAELDAERAKHQELWQLVDKELDRIYADAKGAGQ